MANMSMEDQQKLERRIKRWVFWSLLGVALLIAAGMAGCPQYSVYKARLHGESELARANANREILVAQARSEKEAAVLRAEAIAIVGEAAKRYPEYRQQEFIGAFAEAVKDGKISQIIYVATEAGIPITEARRLAPPPERK